MGSLWAAQAHPLSVTNCAMAMDAAHGFGIDDLVDEGAVTREAVLL